MKYKELQSQGTRIDMPVMVQALLGMLLVSMFATLGKLAWDALAKMSQGTLIGAIEIFGWTCILFVAGVVVGHSFFSFLDPVETFLPCGIRPKNMFREWYHHKRCLKCLVESASG